MSRLAILWADAAYTGWFREWVEEERGWYVEVLQHPDKQLWRYGLKEKPRGFPKCCLADGSSKGRLPGWGMRAGLPKITSGYRRALWP